MRRPWHKEAPEPPRVQAEVASLRADLCRVSSELRTDRDQSADLYHKLNVTLSQLVRENETRAVDELASKQRQGRIARRLSISSLVLGALFTLIVVRTFNEPSLPPYGDLVTLEMTAQVQGEVPQHEPALIYNRTSLGRISYDLYFPKETVGQPFYFSIYGDAAVQNFTASIMADDGTSTQLGAALQVQPDTQSIIGKVPEAPAITPTVLGNSLPFVGTACASTVEGLEGATHVEISGDAHANSIHVGTQLHQWPYRSLTQPRFQLQYEYSGSSSGKPYTVSQTAPFYRLCQERQRDEGFQVISTEPQVSSQSDAVLTWVGPVDTPIITERRSYAEAVANFCIIFAGVAFAVTAGFLPMWIENRSTLRRPRHPLFGSGTASNPPSRALTPPES